MTEHRDLLFELGTEELPPKVLRELSEALEHGIVERLAQQGVAHGSSHRYATPRRLAVQVNEVAGQQPEQRQQRRGPALQAAFTADGQPTRAAEGFARSCGVSVSELETLETDKGSWLCHTRVVPGSPVTELLPGIIATALEALPVPKRMRWGESDAEFSRPVRWLVLLYGETVVPLRLFGLESSACTRGHRFHHPGTITLDTPADYEARLHRIGHVMADFETRLEYIREQVERCAAEVDGRAMIGPALLDEVTALVEWPVALVGNFERRFLDMPPEVLVSTMQDHQRYFPVVDGEGRLLPHFVTVANLESRDPSQIQRGNERVIRPRFSDAEFFWNKDRQHSLDSRREALHQVVFQQQLGTLHDKSRRVQAMADAIAAALDGDAGQARRAAALAKCDLLTDMVQEFPELQGVMGRYYAAHDGETDEVARALEEQYRPAYAGDALPRTRTGQILALADRLDTLLGIFAIGQAPTGNRDPFGLRRAALGVNRILIESALDLDLEELLHQAAVGYEATDIDAGKVIPALFDFMLERLRGYYHDRGVRMDVFESVLVNRPTRPLDFDRRLQAVTAFSELPEAESLAAANKRIRNILKKAPTVSPERIDERLLRDTAERNLAAAIDQLVCEVEERAAAGDYTQALQRLATLRDPVDRFFDQVMVMSEDAVVRDNRLSLLAKLSGLFNRIADISRLQS
ncbi:MAG: glycine--tRNA ligase subunit beta [Candidatus Competibacterales bacterium]|nr:glycine--tRNA ligase subunit beta [Candidatus Competibacterales bacterium]